MQHILSKQQTMKAIAYTRSATVQQDGENQLFRQEIEINLYCQQNNLELLQIFTDNGASGSNLDRAGWKALQNHLKKYKGFIKYLIVADLNRISRDSFLTMSAVRDLEREFGVIVKTVMVPLIEKAGVLSKEEDNNISKMRSERIKQGIRHAAMRRSGGKG